MIHLILSLLLSRQYGGYLSSDLKISRIFVTLFIIIIMPVIMSSLFFISMMVTIVDARGDVDVDADIGLQTVKFRDLAIGFENGTLRTRAQLMLPTVSDGPFPVFF